MLLTLLFSTQIGVSSCTKETVIHDTTTVDVHDTTTIVLHDTVWKTSLLEQHINDSLWAYYPFQGNTNDSSGHNRILTLMNGLKLSSDMWGKTNGCLKFDGIDDYAFIEDGRNFPEGDFTIAMKFICSTLQGRLFQKADYTTAKGASFGLGFAFPGGNFLHYAISQNPGVCNAYSDASNLDLMQTPNLLPDAWYHVVIAHKNGVQKMYLNGKLVASQNTVLPTFVNCTSATFNFGDWWQNDPNRFTGKLDDIRIYTRGLSDDEISYLSKCSMN